MQPSFTQPSSAHPEYAANPDAANSDPQQQSRREAARLMGKVRTEAKRVAVRRNGRLGGRPKGYRVTDDTRKKISQTKRDKAKQENAKQEGVPLLPKNAASEAQAGEVGDVSKNLPK